MAYASRRMRTRGAAGNLAAVTALLAGLSFPILSLAEGRGGDPPGHGLGAGARGAARPGTLVAMIGPLGACCAPDGSCTLTTAADCKILGGTHQGSGTVCAGDADGDGRDDSCPCAIAQDCDDVNVCTDDVCAIGVCVHAPIEGCSDCDGNGIPDHRDIETCPGIPACGDCNVNLLPDACDLVADPSLDQDGDGVPDACLDAQVPGLHNWTDNIWGLPGGDYPSNLGGHASGFFVTLPPAFTINLNTTVEIEGLDVRTGAVLNVTDPVDGDLFIRNGSGGGIRNNGEIQVSTDRVIDVRGGTFTIAGSGRYGASVAALSPVSVALTAKAVILREALCGATDQLTLVDNMSVTTTQDFVMDGTNAIGCPFLSASAGTADALLGGKTSPILTLRTAASALGATSASFGSVVGRTQLTVQGAFRMKRSAIVDLGCESGTDTVVPNVELHGDFDNQSKFPSLFDWSLGKLTVPVHVGAARFEVAGLEIGPTPEGFNTNRPTLFDSGRHRNFSMAIIEIGSAGAAGTSEVQFVNDFANTVGTGSQQEALYVKRLILQANAKVVLGDSNVYYGSLEDRGATIVRNGAGDLIQIMGAIPPEPCRIPTLSQWGLIAMALLLLWIGCWMIRRAGAKTRSAAPRIVRLLLITAVCGSVGRAATARAQGGSRPVATVMVDIDSGVVSATGGGTDPVVAYSEFVGAPDARAIVVGAAVPVLPPPLRGFFETRIAALRSGPASFVTRSSKTEPFNSSSSAASLPTRSDGYYISLDAACRDAVEARKRSAALRFPHRLEEALAFYEKHGIERGGTLPWMILDRYHALTRAMRSGDEAAIVHAVGDVLTYCTYAGLPFNTTRYRHGQRTGLADRSDRVGRSDASLERTVEGRFQRGLLRRFRSRFEYEVRVSPDRFQPIADWPLEAIFATLIDTQDAVGPLVAIDAEALSALGAADPSSPAVAAKAYYDRVLPRAAPVLESRLEAAALLAANLIGTAWLDAGQPAPNSWTVGRASPQIEPPVADADFVGSRHSTLFHRATCSHAKRIKPSNRVVFRTAAEAEAAGRTPCKSCKPAGE